MFCYNCGVEISFEDKFCKKCGVALQNDEKVNNSQIDSVVKQNFQTLYFSHKGKIDKRQFTKAYLGLFGLIMVLFFIVGMSIFTNSNDAAGMVMIVAINIFIASLWSQFVLISKRIRDTGHDVFPLIILIFIPYIGFGFAVYLMLSDSKMKDVI